MYCVVCLPLCAPLSGAGLSGLVHQPTLGLRCVAGGGEGGGAAGAGAAGRRPARKGKGQDPSLTITFDLTRENIL